MNCRSTIFAKLFVLLLSFVLLLEGCDYEPPLLHEEEPQALQPSVQGANPESSTSSSPTSSQTTPGQDLVLPSLGGTTELLSDYEQNKAIIISQDNLELKKLLHYHTEKEKVVHLLQALRDEIVPQAVKALVARFPQAFHYLKEKDIGIGLKLNDMSGTTKASFSMNPMYTDGRPEESVWVIYSLTISYEDLEWTGNQLTDFWRKELEKRVTHEMMHALMCESLTCGFTLWDCNLNQHGDGFPSWFVEGAAETVSAGSSLVAFKTGLNINAQTSPQEITDILTKKHPLTGNSILSQYGVGYLAVMYLSHIAAGGTVYDATSLAQGLDTILSRIHAGESLDGVIKSISNNQFTGLRDFESKFATEGANFVARLMDTIGTGRGALLHGDYSTTDLLPNERYETSLFWLNILKDEYNNKFNDEFNARAVFKGGSSTKTGVPGPAVSQN